MARSDHGHDEPAEWADQDAPGPTLPGEDEQTIGGGGEPVRQTVRRDRLSPLPTIAFAGLALLILVVVLLAVLVGFHALG